MPLYPKSSYPHTVLSAYLSKHTKHNRLYQSIGKTVKYKQPRVKHDCKRGIFMKVDVIYLDSLSFKGAS